MTNLMETAKAYEPKKTPVVSELDALSLSVPITTENGTDNDGKIFEYFVANVAGINYRVPNSVMEQIQSLLEESPNIKTVKIKKKGEGMGTKYQVIVLE